MSCINIPGEWKLIELNYTPVSGLLNVKRKMNIKDVYWCDRYVHIDKYGSAHFGYQFNCGMTKYSLIVDDDEDDEDRLYFEGQFPTFPYHAPTLPKTSLSLV